MNNRVLTYSAIPVVMVTLMLPIIMVDVYAPTVDKLTPTKGQVGQRVTIHGDGFIQCTDPPLAVFFGTIESDGFSVASSKVIKTTVPDIVPGLYDVNLLCNGESIFAGTFTVIG